MYCYCYGLHPELSPINLAGKAMIGRKMTVPFYIELSPGKWKEGSIGDFLVKKDNKLCIIKRGDLL